LEAADGQEALQLGQQYDRQIDLLLVDVVMPQINGKTLSGKLEAIRPKMKVLYTSGYTDNIIAQHGILEPGTMLLKKPFSPGALTQKVREALDQ
jgi:response regulator RpfG family c-di-GMP phosphodiesterase